jgi:cytochrome P450
MVLFPDVQKRVQAELDEVVGRKRLPTFDDRASLPYLEATIKESLRFHPPTPLGIAHRLIEDDIVQGKTELPTCPWTDPIKKNYVQAIISRRAQSFCRTFGR